jgi:hypothetical protein
VRAVDLTELRPSADGPVPDGGAVVRDAVPAFGARWDAATGRATPAELLLIHPAAPTLTEMSP